MLLNNNENTPDSLIQKDEQGGYYFNPLILPKESYVALLNTLDLSHKKSKLFLKRKKESPIKNERQKELSRKNEIIFKANKAKIKNLEIDDENLSKALTRDGFKVLEPLMGNPVSSKSWIATAPTEWATCLRTLTQCWRTQIHPNPNLVYHSKRPLGLITVNPISKTLMVAFTGSISNPDWLSNVFSSNDDGADRETIHAGFRKTFETLENDLYERVADQLRTLKNSNPEIKKTTLLLTGHSRGSAIAAIAALKLKAYLRTQQDLEDSFLIKGVYLSSPRAFYLPQEDQEIHNIDFIRINHVLDFVPNAAPRRFGFYSNGLLILDKRNAKYFGLAVHTTLPRNFMRTSTLKRTLQAGVTKTLKRNHYCGTNGFDQSFVPHYELLLEYLNTTLSDPNHLATGYGNITHEDAAGYNTTNNHHATGDDEAIKHVEEDNTNNNHRPTVQDPITHADTTGHAPPPLQL